MVIHLNISSMKNLLSSCVKVVFLVILFAFSANAQKLPNVQEASLRAPATIKIDGKSTEWNNQFQAYNKATEIFYTISNDNEKLYLTVQATDLDIINKIICAGIIFTINGTGKMKDQEGMAITFPVLHEGDFPHDSHGSLIAPPVNLDKPDSWSADTFLVVLNKDLTSKAKDIRVTGGKEITNSLISIYNPYGIKVAALVDNNTNFTYELAVPLKYLGLSVNNSKPFVYNIKLKSLEGGTIGLEDRSFVIALRAQRRERRAHLIVSRNESKTVTVYDDRMLNLLNPTDFWGEYTLAK